MYWSTSGKSYTYIHASVDYVVVDDDHDDDDFKQNMYRYQLNTEAGFLIGRQAVLSLTSVGDGYLQGLVAVTTDKRWRGGLESSIRDIAQSFRVYRLNSGIFSAN
jgi:hypothetical protein